MENKLAVIINDQTYHMDVNIAKLIPAFSSRFDGNGHMIQNRIYLNRTFMRDESISTYFRIFDLLKDEVEGYRIIKFEHVIDLIHILGASGIAVTYKSGIIDFKIGNYQMKYKCKLDLELFLQDYYHIDELKFHDNTNTYANCIYSGKSEFDNICGNQKPIKYLCKFIRFIGREFMLSELSQFVNIIGLNGEEVNVNAMTYSEDDSEVQNPPRRRQRRPSILSYESDEE